MITISCRCVLDPGDKIVDCPPTFTMYEFDAAVNGAFVIKGTDKFSTFSWFLLQFLQSLIHSFINVNSCFHHQHRVPKHLSFICLLCFSLPALLFICMSCCFCITSCNFMLFCSSKEGRF